MKSNYKVNEAFELEPGAEKDVDHPVGDFTPTRGDFTPLTYSWNNIDVHTKPTSGCFGFNKITETKQILKGVSGICRPGELLAIMGASGAGKTTLLNVLTGRSNELLDVTGDLQLNGQSIRPYQLANRSAYVQQDDLFIGTMTVKEQLIFQARLRMERNVPNSVRMNRVREVISELGLTKCQNTYIGIPGKLKGISGGETKRLAFACEVLTNPPLMFCDEPTTGLDSFMAQTIVEAMRSIARQGHTIISTIHQPSSEVFSMFDRVLLMAEGRIAFLGYTKDALEFFKRSGKICPKNFNPADFFIACLAVNPECEDESRVEITKICDAYDKEDGLAVRDMVLKNNQGVGFIVENEVDSPMYKTGYFGQFSAVFKRSIFQVIRQPDQLRIKLIQTIMIAVLLGLLFLNQELNQNGALNLQSCLFLMLTNMSFNNAFSVVNTFCADLTVVRREHDNMMYRTDVFFLAKSFAELPVVLMQPVIFVGTIYFMVGLYPDVAQFFICMGIVTLIANIGVSYGYFISCMAKNLEMAMAISAPLLIPLMVFGGFLINTDSVPDWYVWLKYISWFNYGNEALSINQWEDVQDISCSDLVHNGTCHSSGKAQLEFFSFKTKNFGFDVGMLVVLLVGYRLLAYIFLYIKFYRKKSK